MKIAVDFDGTIVENKYPRIGKPRLFAFEVMKALQGEGHLLVLWTCRYGNSLAEAVNFCRENGVEFYAVNANYPEENLEKPLGRSPKINADIYIDDRQIGGFIGWSEIWQQLSDADNQRSDYGKELRSKNLWERIFK